MSFSSSRASVRKVGGWLHHCLKKGQRKRLSQTASVTMKMSRAFVLDAPDHVAPADLSARSRLTESDFFLRPEISTDGATRGRNFAYFWQVLLRHIGETAERFIPIEWREHPELVRRARLVARFGILGAAFGCCFALFYAVVGHSWGAGIVTVCSLAFALVPQLMRRKHSINFAGNVLCGILILGFTALCACEGGSEGHAIAWLVSVPLCALLLLGRAAAGCWAVLSFAAGAGVVAANLLGWEMHPTYDPAWHPVINAAGYLALIIFMFLLGVIFESSRERAFAKMTDANLKLATSNEELARLNQEKNEFLGIAAHDLKNPLTVIIGSAELLKMNLSPQQTTKLANNIVNASQRMVHLIKDLLDANAIEQGKFTSNIAPCDLRTLVAECAANNQAHGTRKEIVICTEDGPAIWGLTDRNATMQILDNLISNALKFSPRKSTVQIKLSRQNEAVFVAVSDQGPGLSTEDQKKLFGKFVRLSAQPTGGESSTGLGLSIVKKLAEAMNGTVSCQSQPGAGATFILRLPACADGEIPPAKSSAGSNLNRDVAQLSVAANPTDSRAVRTPEVTPVLPRL